MSILSVRKTFESSSSVSEAEYSICGLYRFRLTRTWDRSGRHALFIMLNPSTATEIKNDPSVERCERRARALEFGSFTVCNLFAYRSTNPKKLKEVGDPNGIGNDEAIESSSDSADIIVCAWGNHGAHLNRGKFVESMLRDNGCDLHHLGITAQGFPKHPLYVSYSVKPFVWERCDVPRMRRTRHNA